MQLGRVTAYKARDRPEYGLMGQPQYEEAKPRRETAVAFLPKFGGSIFKQEKGCGS